MPDDRYAYDRFGKKGQRVGQAVIDLLSKSQPVQTVGDTIDAFGPDYAKQVEQCIEDNQHKYKSPFYLFVLTKKEFWADNVLRNFFIARQTPPHAFQMMEEYSNFTKTLYIVDADKGKVKILWSLPGFNDCITVAKHPELYAPELVKWIEECFSRKLDKEKYSFDE
jgi:hypothetical protein